MSTSDSVQYSHIALLRAINVGGKNKVAMADLKHLFEELGFGQVKALLQTGNILFNGDGRTDKDMEAFLDAETAQRLQVKTDYIIRTAAEWRALVAANPFTEEARNNPGYLLVMILKTAPSEDNIRALQAAIPGREIAKVVGRQAYILYPDGMGRSKLTVTLIEKKLGSRGTTRNWNTILKIQNLI